MGHSLPFVEEIFTRLRRHNAHPQSELDFFDPFTLLIAVVLSAQSTDRQVNRLTPKLFQQAPHAHALAQLTESDIHPLLRSLGLYKVKTQYILALARQLVRDHNGQVPQTRQELEALPGVGRKTAGVVLNVAFGHGEIPVDTHVFRVSHRLGLGDASTPQGIEHQLQSLIPESWKVRAHHDLLLHGRYVCKAKKPLCSSCVLRDLCPAFVS